jgi:iron-sulfur cluster repair protein YtfE (RIC family)
MRQEQVWLYPNTGIETVLRTRPMAVELFDHLGLEPWKMFHATISDLGEEGGIPWPDLEQAILGMPVPAADSPWASLPLCRLIDHLARQHREFLREFLPAIGHVLSDFAGSDGDSLMHLRMLALEWPAFASALSEHIQEEEEVFLHLLRQEACLRKGLPAPLPAEDFPGLPAALFEEQENRDVAVLRRFLAQALPVPEVPGEDRLEHLLRPLLKAFEAALERHARLEAEILMPRGLALEKSLRNPAGANALPGRVKSAAGAG